MMPNRTTALILLRCTGFLCLLSLPLSTAMAQAGWINSGQVGVFAETDDNPRLTPNTFAESDSIGTLEANLSSRYSGQRGDFAIVPRVRARSYTDERNEDLEGSDLFLRSFAEYRWTAVQLGYRFDIANQSVRSSETASATPDDPDIEDPEDVGSGELIFLAQNQERTTVTPYIEFRISDRNSFRFDARYNDVKYTGPGSENRTDFSNNEAAVSLIRRVDDRNSVSARMYITDYEAERSQNQTDTVGVEGIFSRPITETWTFNLTAGVQRADFVFLDNGEVVDNADSGFAFDLGFRRRAERTTTNINIRRRLRPNSSGHVVRQDEIWLYSRRNFSQRVTGGLGLRYSENRGLDNAPASGDRDYARAELSLEWTISRRMFVSIGYNYTFQEFIDDVDREAESNSLYLGFNFRSGP